LGPLTSAALAGRERRAYLRDVSSILHVDMDAFYASVHVRDDPSLSGLPVAVGGSGGRGVVMSASYEARAFGVRSAMPSARARRLCPGLVFVAPDFSKYTAESTAVMDILSSFTPLVEQLSLDEAFLEVSGATRLFGAPAEIAKLIRERVKRERGLVCSVGVAPNKFLAKLASERAKPDGICHVEADRAREFLDPLPVAALWGVGEQTANVLDRLGIRTVAELRAASDRGEMLQRALGPALAGHLVDIAHGRDERTVVVHEAAKQVSAEETFERDLETPEQIRRELLRLAERVARRLRRGDVSARTVTIKVRFSTFKTITRSRTLAEPVDTGAKLYAAARELYEALALEHPRIRLLGVAATGLGTAVTEQLRLGARPDPWRRASAAMDKVRERFGSGAVDLAAIADPTTTEREAPE
jgi:DNA polymerase-4